MKRPGRGFEILVARIEQCLLPKGASVCSPDRIRSKTGGIREVDASIRFQVGSTPILITIECRDRSTKEDVCWIEQLAQKRDNIGAARTIAVSKRGFSAEAEKVARRCDIELRKIDEVTESEILEWPSKTKITLIYGQLDLRVRPHQT